MTIYELQNGLVVRIVTENANQCLSRTVFGYYSWKPYDGEISEQKEEIELQQRGWVSNGNDVWFKTTTTTDIEESVFTNETGGFTKAEGEFADQMHEDTTWFDNFKPRTAGERRFKQMVESLEQRARFEEENKL